MKLPSPAVKLCNKLLDLEIEPIIVGGFVRDYFLETTSKDIDIEVYNINSLDNLASNLQEFGTIHFVGKAFGVLKLSFDGYDFDISLPRTENKIAKGHKGFEVITDGFLSYEEAASRRDFTMNSIGYDFKKNKLLDPFNGINDISNKRIKHIQDKSFVEDPLRVLRAVQFSARFNFKLDANTLKLCTNMVKEKMLEELPKERIFEEYKKLLLKADKPSIGFKLLDKLNALCPELKATQNIPQDKTYHPEGDVWTHTLMSIDAMSQLKTNNEKKDLILMLAILCHDLGKVEATTVTQDKIRAIGHENILEPTISLIEKLSDDKAILKEVLPLVKEHLMPSTLYSQKSKSPAIRRLSTRVNIQDLSILARADHFGRTTQDAKDKIYLAGDWLLEKAKNLNVQYDKPKAILLGRDLLQEGYKAGVIFKKILDAAYEEQLNGTIIDKESALKWLKTIF